jgi:glycosyltransferase involved in cell wall biosynthesis
MEKVSIIVPIFNSELTLNRCLDSAINQSYENIELILVNDGSTDKSEEICKEYAKKYHNIKYIYKKNSGVSNTRNIGIKESTGKYLLFLDSDDTIDKNVILELVNEVKSNILIGVMHTNYLKNNYIKKEYEKKELNRDEFFDETLNGNITGTLWGFLFDKEKCSNISFDENTGYIEDAIFLYDYLIENNISKIKFIEKHCYYNYFINENSVTNNTSNIKKKCMEIIYSYDKLDEITHQKYHVCINNRKISLIENKLQLLNNKNDMRYIVNNIKFEKPEQISARLKLYYYIFNSKNILLINFYYTVRKILKKLKKENNLLIK